MKARIKVSLSGGSAKSPIAVAALLAVAGAVQGMEIDTGNPDLTIRWDNTVKYSLASRVKSAASASTAPEMAPMPCSTRPKVTI